jgi:hypothetical protein
VKEGFHENIGIIDKSVKFINDYEELLFVEFDLGETNDINKRL